MPDTPKAPEPDRALLREVVENLAEAVAVLRVRPHLQVAMASDSAERYGLVRNGTITHRGVRGAIRRARTTGESVRISITLTAAAGNPQRHLDVTVTPLSVEGVLVEAVDRSSVQRVDATRRDFVANVSHELKTPIGGLLLLSEAVEEAAEDPDAVRHFSQRLQTEAIRLTDMVNQLIDLSRLQSEDPLSNAEPVIMEEVVDEALGRCQMPASRKDMTLLTIGGVEGEVWGDESKLIDAVANLVLNAIAYSDDGSRVEISLRRVVEGEESWIDVAVADHGIGIAQSDLDRIFERFYRVDYGRSRSHGGTGLGLSIVRHIAEVHGGSVSVVSTPGVGSTFTLRLPELTDSDHPAAPARGGSARGVSEPDGPDARTDEDHSDEGASDTGASDEGARDAGADDEQETN